MAEEVEKEHSKLEKLEARIQSIHDRLVEQAKEIEDLQNRLDKVEEELW